MEDAFFVLEAQGVVRLVRGPTDLRCWFALVFRAGVLVVAVAIRIRFVAARDDHRLAPQELAFAVVAVRGRAGGAVGAHVLIHTAPSILPIP